MVVANTDFIGKGAYSIPDAARLVGKPCNTVRGWLDPERGIVTRAYAPEKHVISFAELMEIHFIKMFIDEGVHPRVIRAAAQKAAKAFHTDYPFAVKRFDTDGRTIFATLANDDGDVMTEDLRRGQLVFTTIIRPFFKKLEYNRAEISRYWPLGKRGRVTIQPDRHFGQPIDNDSGIPTSTLYRATLAGKGQSVKKVANWYGVPEASVRAAVAFEKSIA